MDVELCARGTVVSEILSADSLDVNLEFEELSEDSRRYTAVVNNEPRIHPSADVSREATIGNRTSIWHGVHVREGVRIGSECIIGKDVYLDAGVSIGDRCKIQNNASIFHGSTLEDGVFVGPHVCLTNDRFPRAITPDGHLKRQDDWDVGTITLCYGSSIGACTVILPGIRVGRFALVGSGSVVTHDVPDHGLVMGNPARFVGYVCACGRRLTLSSVATDAASPPRDGYCNHCQKQTILNS